jgi:hypothetical protein
LIREPYTTRSPPSTDKIRLTACGCNSASTSIVCFAMLAWWLDVKGIRTVLLPQCMSVCASFVSYKRRAHIVCQGWSISDMMVRVRLETSIDQTWHPFTLAIRLTFLPVILRSGNKGLLYVLPSKSLFTYSADRFTLRNTIRLFQHLCSSPQKQ